MTVEIVLAHKIMRAAHKRARERHGQEGVVDLLRFSMGDLGATYEQEEEEDETRTRARKLPSVPLIGQLREAW